MTVDRDKILREQDRRCVKCRIEYSDRSLEVHHIEPRYLGGSDDRSNLALLCTHCHRFVPDWFDGDEAKELFFWYKHTNLRPEVDLVLFGSTMSSSLFDNIVDIGPEIGNAPKFESMYWMTFATAANYGTVPDIVHKWLESDKFTELAFNSAVLSGSKLGDS